MYKIRSQLKTKKDTRKQIEKKLDNVFSLYIRLRDLKKGCITCSSVFDKHKGYKEWQAGHFLSRKYKATRWDETNVHGQCSSCNRAQHFADVRVISRHTKQINKMYGNDYDEILSEKTKGACYIPMSELREKLKYFENKYKELLNESN